ncbi:MAG: ABC transporter ATP-binding protein [Chloroflexi bacterium]|nr:ABC transporter ATP-binding protein [Chloroflexota bacterium]
MNKALVVDNVSKYFDGKSEVSLLKQWQARLTGGEIEKPKPINAVKDVTFEVNRREIYGVLGPNGSGKSTLIRMISTLLIPDEGTITVFGCDSVKEEIAVKRMINRVSVDAAFFKKLSPRENLLYGARLYGVSAAEADVTARDILQRLGLRPNSYTAPMEEMSRGMQQKVAIARAFLTQPILLLLDEPTTGLDPRSKREVQAFINELRDTHDATIVLTTHDMQEAEALCERIAILDEGEIVAEDTPDGLKRRVKGDNGNPPTLDDVFLQLTGKHLVKEDESSEEEVIEPVL